MQYDKGNMWKQMMIVIVVALISLAIFWMPFLAKANQFWGIEYGKHGMETIVANFDGLNYLAVAKTLYDPKLLETNFAGFGNPAIYYSAHFPVYPLLIRALDYVMTGPQAIMWSIVISNIALSMGLYLFFVTLIKDPKAATVLAIICLFFPARMLSVRSVGTSEPLFMFFVLTSLGASYRGKHFLGAGLGALAVLTRSPGIFLFGAYVLAAIASYKTDWRKIITKIYPYLMMPMALILLFGFYAGKYGNFWAYFNNSSELHPVFFPPFLIFSNAQKWITDMWREDIIYMYLLYSTGIVLYIKQLGTKCGFEKLASVGYGVFYGLILLLISHRDIARYALPLGPIALLGFAPMVKSRYFRWAALLIIPIYLLGWQFVVANVQPVSDWSSLL